MEQKELCKAKILDKIKIYEKSGEIVSTLFLNPSEIVEHGSIYEKYLHTLQGGFEEAERKLLIIGADDVNILDYISIIEVVSNKPLGHRDVLGSVLGTGVKRDVIGDIVIKDNVANIYATKDISKYLIQNLDKIGKEKVKVRIIDIDNRLPYEVKTKLLKTTVASLRLDAAIASCYGISREVSSELIKNLKVNLNYKEVSNASKPIKQGDLISVKGYGRFELSEVLGETRKDRIRVVFNVYGK